jgi:aarF domain-containing kinase
MDYLTVQKVA